GLGAALRSDRSVRGPAAHLRSRRRSRGRGVQRRARRRGPVDAGARCRQRRRGVRTLMAASANAVATLDARSYLERALAHGFAHGLLAEAHRARMQEEGAKALVQIANHFGTAYLRANLETALLRFATLASLYLEDKFGSDLHAAACSLRDNTLLSHSRGGS